MTGRRWREVGWLGGALVASLPVLLLGGCPSEPTDSTTGGGSGGGAAGGAAGGDASAGWDPVWHDTQPKDWPNVGPENNPDCGPGCRVALNVPMTNPVAYGHRYTEKWLVSQSPVGIAFTAPATTKTWIVEEPTGALVQPNVWGDHVSYLRSFGVGHGQVELTSLITGETKVVFEYGPPDAGTSANELTALNGKYAFFVYKGFRVRDLETGQLSYLGGGACYSLCATEDAFICESGKIYLVNPLTGEQKQIDDGTELQWAGACSPDRKQYVWVDYRDPPGPGSTPFFARSGGEIYWHDFASKTTKRATFDSPGAPRAKAYPAVGDGLAVWNEPPSSATDPNPSEYGPYQSACTALATLDLATGQRCQLSGARPLAWKSVHGRHVYAAWIDKAKNEMRLVDIDLDSPELTWSCVPTPGWGQ